MFQKKIPTAVGVAKNHEDAFSEFSVIKKIVYLIKELSLDFDSMSNLYEMPDEHTVYVLFEEVGFECDEFLAEYGEIIASISKTHSISVSGMLENLEMGELTAYFNEDGLCRKKSNVSGERFDVLSSVYVKIILNSKEEAAFLLQLLANCKVNNIAFSRKYESILNENEFIGDHELTHFLYLKLEDTFELEETLLQSLTVPQMAELWEIFLRDGVTAVEFDMIYEKLSTNFSPMLLRLELALQLAINKLNIRITNDENGFSVYNQDGNRYKFDFLSSSAAEKLFLKILFPVNII